MQKPFFCVIEGIDGSGKGTQLGLLENHLKKNKFDVIATREPTQTLTGYFLKIVLKMGSIHPRTDAFLFAADRSEHVEKLIVPALKKNQIVICERYLYSSIAYQAADVEHEELVRKINGFAIKPDLVILIDVDPEVTMKRKENVLHYEGEKFENVEFLNKVRKKYHQLAEEYHMIVVNGNKEVDDVHNDIVRIFNNHYEKKSVQLQVTRFLE